MHASGWHRFLFLPLLLFGLIGLHGCASPGKTEITHDPPRDHVFVNQAEIDLPFEDCWSNLVEGLSGSFLIIDSADKNSGIMSLSFILDDPEDYVDCGRTTRVYTKGEKTEVFAFDNAADHRYRFDSPRGSSFSEYRINKEAQLEGKVNVFLAALPEGTRFIANVQYELEIITRGQHTKVSSEGFIQSQNALEEKIDESAFHTGGSGQIRDQECVPTGRIEEMLLDMARGGDAH